MHEECVAEAISDEPTARGPQAAHVSLRFRLGHGRHRGPNPAAQCGLRIGSFTAIEREAAHRGQRRQETHPECLAFRVGPNDASEKSR